MGEVVQLRDYKRKEEARSLEVLAEHSDVIVRMEKEWSALLDTAPSEMPPVQPMYVAPTKDPA